MELTEKEKQAQKIIINEVEKMVRLLENHLQKYCDERNTASVPINYIHTSCSLLLKGFNDGVKGLEPKE